MSAPGTQRCPNCACAIQFAEFRPFCSARCKDVDLSRWLSGAYAIPGGNYVDEDEDGDRRGSAEIDNLTKARGQPDDSPR